MNIEEARKHLKKNLNNWKKLKKDNGYMPEIMEEINTDYEAIETLLTAYEEKCKELEKEKEKNKEYKNLLIDMVNQFAYEDNNPKTTGSSEEKLYTEGLSTLEDVFDLLDIDEGIKRENLWKLKEE